MIAHCPIAISTSQLRRKSLQNVDVFLVAAAAFDDADIAALREPLDVGQRRAVDLDQLHQLDQPLVDVEDRHVAAETPRKRGGRDAGLSGSATALPLDLVADQALVEFALADRHREADALADDAADRADLVRPRMVRHIASVCARSSPLTATRR
jgi:hypothetical protein